MYLCWDRYLQQKCCCNTTLGKGKKSVACVGVWQTKICEGKKPIPKFFNTIHTIQYPYYPLLLYDAV